MTLKRGQKIVLRPSSFSDDGEGVAEVDGVSVRVAGAAPGDEVEAVVEHLSPHEPVAWAGWTQALVEGPARMRPPCHHAAPLRGACGGCPLMHLTPAAATEVRQGRVSRALEAAGFAAPDAWHVAPSTLGWRNRTRYLTATHTDGTLRLGSRARRTGEFAPMGGCRVVQPIIDATAMALAAIADDEGLGADGPGSPGLRWVVVRANVDEQVLVELITPSNVSWGLLDRVGARIGELPGVVGVVSSVADHRGNAIVGERPRVLAGSDALVERTGDVELTLAHDAFFQLNTAVAQAMYARAADHTADAATVWDLYCGVGGLGIVASRGRSAQLHGLDVGERAIEAARSNATAAGVGATYRAADLRAGLPDDLPPPDVVLVNPPRRGIDEPVLARLAALEQGRIVYMSCDAGSFARDAASLRTSGWRIVALEAWEMLPQTPHVELLGVLERA